MFETLYPRYYVSLALVRAEAGSGELTEVRRIAQFFRIMRIVRIFKVTTYWGFQEYQMCAYNCEHLRINDEITYVLVCICTTFGSNLDEIFSEEGG